ncbi:MAG: lysine--tRNA ligase [Brevinemataceae bacterium]
MTNNSVPNNSNEREMRLAKINAWKNFQKDPFTPRPDTPRTTFSKDLINSFKENSSEQHQGTVAGRIILNRNFGKAGFITLQDEHDCIQLYFKKDILGENLFEEYKLLDLGDIISASGKMFFTQKGEPTLEINNFQILTKALRPLPEKFHGLEDIETRYRKRYLDLIINTEVKETFIFRSKLVQTIREYLTEKGFLEVETPMMHPIPGGAAARPFITHHNALNTELYLRIAPELYLKRLVVGGMHKVFEINRNFRNEGVDSTHNPEFTMLELYEAYSDWEGMADLFVNLISEAATRIKGSTIITFKGKEIDISQWKKISYSEALKAKGLDPNILNTRETAVKEAEKHGIEISDDMGRWAVLAELFDKLISDFIEEPTIVYDYPAEISPLSKRKLSDPELAERFEAYAFGMELSNGFSELNDPIIQRNVFEDQACKKNNGDDEAMWLDEDYIEALEQGLPPTGGIGIGIDRLAMIFTDSNSIRDVILFPAMKQKL